MSPIVSIIVPCYNYGHFLAECLNSVLGQINKDWECLVVDNGSTDNTAEVTKQFTTKDSRFKYIHTEQKGVSFARNTGIQQSQGKYILPLDADDKIEPLFIKRTLSEIEKRPATKLVYSNARLFGDASGNWVLPEYSFKGLLIENSIFCTSLFRKSDFDLTKGYNEEMKDGFEDWDFWISLLKTGGEVYRVPEVLFNYRIRSQSRNHSLDKNRQTQLRKQIFNNHKESYEAYFSLPDLVFENYLISQELQRLKASKDLRLGGWLMDHLRLIKKLFSKGA